MDKTWIDLPRMSRDYFDGIDRFLEFAYTDKLDDSFICCPCRKCKNRYCFPRAAVRKHLYSCGFFKKYKNWTNHGESYAFLSGEQSYGTFENSIVGDDMVGMIGDALRNQHTGASVGNDERIPNEPQKGPDEATTTYLKLLENANTELYPGCKNSLSFIVRLLHMKVLNKLTNNTIDKFLAFYHEAFPEALNLSNSYYEAQKITDDLGFTYKTWDACPRS
ncbi:hypothetical protein RHMOL_Rhmol04G0192800 [Rhododendron molle]|uniref:Uncharacterized protein n=1 Tax=Rhododendron molle TaxID=49168 RepID=A0ACC0P3X4_RHOML|nr:hypothetical protein RHMOL_Rhmol04G0192800 [Rhododendron molle]